jgi:hypothetical protein
MVFLGRRMRGAVLRLTARAGPVDLDVPEPELWRNRQYADLGTVASFDEPRDLERSGAARGVLEIPFAQPLALASGESVLLDVELELAAGVRLAASPDPDGRAALDEPGEEPLLPAAYLLVAGGRPQARSLWYDSGVDGPRWQAAGIVSPDRLVPTRVHVEFQSARAGRDGQPDARSASPWKPDLGEVPAWRYVRFRVRFGETLPGAEPPRLDSIALPFER